MGFLSPKAPPPAPVAPPPPPAATPATAASAATQAAGGRRAGASAAGGKPVPTKAGGTIGALGPEGLTAPPQTAGLTLLGGTK